MRTLYIGIDFDGTMVKQKYPYLGDPLDNAVEVVHKLMEAGHKIILYTMRSGDRLEEAVEYMEENGIVLWAVNENPSQKYWTESPKIFCNMYIDDCALGIPMDEDGVDWYEIEELLEERGIIE